MRRKKETDVNTMNRRCSKKIEGEQRNGNNTNLTYTREEEDEDHMSKLEHAGKRMSCPRLASTLIYSNRNVASSTSSPSARPDNCRSRLLAAPLAMLWDAASVGLA